ncbi:MAG TPA: adenosylcobalamin-dependent ribonucleoside-diphosphate reductase [Flexilinea sp.]|nr:adenosylcobalamin-dependent ribonucleoside-diphosphate reductase [Flexilinea sp.]HQF79426.1 adenosylcobalamin-dependent ribonucleoside-diphosphate reductase [Flexilinea sp.]
MEHAKEKDHQPDKIYTPPMPEGLPSISLTENSIQVLTKRYVRRGEDGKPIETIDEMFWRVAYHVALAEKNYGGDVIETAIAYYKLMVNKLFFPNSPTFTGAGTPLGQLAACFVLPISDDMGKKSTGIFQTLRDAALIQQTGGGNGFSFSRLRPKGTIVRSSAGQATGPVGFLRVYDHAFGEIAQGGSRRGANMAVLRIDHPDIEDFICCKTNENSITNFNISVGITDDFMKAVEEDASWDLIYPDLTSPLTKEFDGDVQDAKDQGLPIKVYKTVRARDLFDLIVNQAHHNGEPGVLFIDQANRFNPVPNLYRLESTNPCGEQWLGPYENCCLGSINLAQHVLEDGSVDWEKLEQSTVLATRFLDDVIDVNAYVPAVPQLKEAALRARRIGLGIMGLADLMFNGGIRYGSEEGQEFASQVMEFIRYHSMKESIRLAEERGAFPAIKGSIYDPDAIKWQIPTPLNPYRHDWNRPETDWEQIKEGMHRNGIRNAAQTTIAPTGTIATVTGCEGYGCEPAFALAYVRHMNDNGKDVLLSYASPLFEKAMIKSGLDESTRKRLVDKVMEKGSCQGIEEIPEEIRRTFVVSGDISAEEHIRMQASLQAFVDNSLSKTINFPEGTGPEEIAKAYVLAWKLGCKGTTVYVTGSREKVVLETKKTAEEKQQIGMSEILPPTALKSEDSAQIPLWYEVKKPRPRALRGFTYRAETPLGKAFVTINENGGNQPFEVFINTAKAGSETSAISEAIGRLISYTLRIASPLEPVRRLRDIQDQLRDIGGGRSLGFGANRVRSLPDGLAQVLAEYLEEREERLLEQGTDVQPKKKAREDSSRRMAPTQNPMLRIGDLCPECGQASVINEEGCRKCYSCGYSEC